MIVIIASDSHRRNDRLKVLENRYPNALFLHAGDFQEDPQRFDHWISVLGNNDPQWEGSTPWKRVVLVEGHRVLLLHGHQAPVKDREQRLVQMAREENCDVVVFGHSHVPVVENKDGILLLNPGSLYRSRKVYGPTYIIADFQKDSITARIAAFPEN